MEIRHFAMEPVTSREYTTYLMAIQVIAGLPVACTTNDPKSGYNVWSVDVNGESGIYHAFDGLYLAKSIRTGDKHELMIRRGIVYIQETSYGDFVVMMWRKDGDIEGWFTERAGFAVYDSAYVWANEFYTVIK